MDEARRYGFEEIETAVAGYGIEEHLAEEQKKADAAGRKRKKMTDRKRRQGRSICRPAEDIRQQILHGHGERSDSSFGLIGRMHREGYSDRTIRDAIMRSRHF
jgi:hypothetical protein